MEEMQKRFHALGAERERILASSAPHRAAREEIRGKIQALELEMQPLNAEVKRIEAPMYQIDMERAALARALNGKTGMAG